MVQAAVVSDNYNDYALGEYNMAAQVPNDGFYEEEEVKGEDEEE